MAGGPLKFLDDDGHVEVRRRKTHYEIRDLAWLRIGSATCFPALEKPPHVVRVSRRRDPLIVPRQSSHGHADFPFLDLEDSGGAQGESERPGPRSWNAIRTLAWDDVSCACASSLGYPVDLRANVIDVVANAGERLDEVMLPRLRRASDVVALDLLLSQVEEERRSPRGSYWHPKPRSRRQKALIQRRGNLAASPRLESSSFRPPARFAASIRHRGDDDRRPIHRRSLRIPSPYGLPPRSSCRPRANGLQSHRRPPFWKVRDLEALRLTPRRSPRLIGFDGKLGVDPEQAFGC